MLAWRSVGLSFGVGVVLLPDRTVGFDEALEVLGLGQGNEIAGDEELVVEERFFEVAFKLVRLLCQAGEFEHVRITDEVGDVLRGVEGLLAGVLDDSVFVGGKAGAFVEE